MDRIPIFLGPRNARDIGLDFAFNLILPFRLSDGKEVLLDYGRVPVGKEAEISISHNHSESTDIMTVEAMLDRPEKVSVTLHC